MRHAFGYAALLMMTLWLVGCGQKGPLYLPGDEEAAEQYDPSGEHQNRTEEAPANRNADTTPPEDEE